MPRWVFVLFEVVFSIPIIVYLVNPNLVFANAYMSVFAVLMFMNGIEHVIWALVKKSYVPGLFTAPILILIFLMFYASLLIYP